jgi:GlpG protein
MRLVGGFEREKDGEKRADRFRRHLAAQGVQTEVREDETHFNIWVFDEDKLPEAADSYTAFIAAPDDTRFNSSTRLPSDLVPGKTDSRARTIDVRREVFNRPRQLLVTLGIILLSVVLTMMSSTDHYMGFIRLLYYSEYMGRSFPEIAGGQVWRIVTPIFLHSGLLHLGFNMLWTWQLGGQIEALQGSRFLLLFVLIFAAICDTSQYLVSGPLFVGISGVVYALLGYIWMMSRFEAAGRYNLESSTVVIMVFWLVACVIGVIPNVANTQHIVGFAGGTAFGYLYSGGLKAELRRRRYRRNLR